MISLPGVLQATDNIKAWLWRYRYAKLEVRRLEGEYRELVETQESTGAINYDGIGGSSGSIADLSSFMVQRDESLAKLNRAIAHMCMVRAEITDAISKLSYEKERTVLSLRYIQLRDQFEIRSMSEIAARMNCSESRAKTLHSLALQNLSEVLKKGIEGANNTK